MDRRIPILAYHSWRFSSGEYHDNDHVALSEDLALINQLGLQVVPLALALREAIQPHIDRPLVAITFDDGAKYDVSAAEPVQGGRAPGFLGILDNASRKRRWWRKQQPTLHATSFVIASSAAHEQMNAGLGPEYGWIAADAWSSGWWGRVASIPFLALGNHSWDHNHPSVEPAMDVATGDFHCVNNLERAEIQVRGAQLALQKQLGADVPHFAYPWGHCPEYLRDEFFPRYGKELGIEAAFTTEPDLLRFETNCWAVPRFVCGDHWTSVDELRMILCQAK